MANNFKPLIDAKNREVELGRSIAVTKMYEYLDLDGNELEMLRVTDLGHDAASGFFTYRGNRLNAGQTYEFAAANLKYLRYHAGLSVGQELYRLQAYDGGFWSDADSATVFSIQPNNQKPVVEWVSTFTPTSNESYRVDAIASASDGDGEPIMRYRFRYVDASGGVLKYKDQVVGHGQWVEFDSADLRFLTLEMKGFASPVRKINLFGRAYDGRDWGDTAKITYTIKANNNRGVLTMFDPDLRVNTEFKARNFFTFKDAENNTPKKARFFDTGVRAEGGFFTYDGVKQNARQWFTVDYADLGKVKYHAASVFDKETIRVQVYDGRYWSKIGTSKVETIDVPVITSDTNVVMEDIEDRLLSSFFTQTDNGPNIRKYRIYDSNTDNRSARLIDANGNRMDQGKVIELTAAEFKQIILRGGKSEFRWHDEIMIRGYNGQEWSTWDRLNVFTEPNHLDAFDLGPRWNQQFGDPRELTYTFLQEPPFYYVPGDQELNNFIAYTPEQRIGARRGLSRWANVSGLSFRETTQEDNLGHITFGTANLGAPNLLAWAYLPFSIFPAKPGDIWLNNQAPSNLDQTEHGLGYGTHLHEMGHAFGLAHPFDDGAGDIRPFLPASTDSLQFTTMSYTGHPTMAGIEPDTPQLYDIAAIQALYGANMNYNSGADTYKWSRNEVVMETIWDGGGRDVIDLSNQVAEQLIDLRQGSFMNVAGGTNNLVIAFNATIESAKGGLNNDIINGNEVRNVLTGYAGDDTLRGYGGTDVLRGFAGNDTYIYQIGDGNDIIREGGQGGRDVLQIDVQEGLYRNFADNPLENSMRFRKIGDNLEIALVMDNNDGRGTIQIDKQGKGAHRVETLRLMVGGEEVELDIDLTSVHQLATNKFQHFQVTEFKTQFGYIATPV